MEDQEDMTMEEEQAEIDDLRMQVEELSAEVARLNGLLAEQ